MKKLTAHTLALVALLSAQPALADFTTVFNDPCTVDAGCSGFGATGTPQYYGGNGTIVGGDIIGAESDFDILSMTVSQSGANLVVSVLTRFIEGFIYDGQNPSAILYGDLMLSTTGWHPYGTAPYAMDTASNSGTNWNYVVQTTTGNIYSNASLENSNTAPNDGTFRADQYVGYANGGTNVGSAGVAINDPGNLPNLINGAEDASGTELTYTIPLAALGLPVSSGTEVALRWTMTCANDIVEAAVSIPEPATLGLFLTGLAGLRLLGRNRREGKGASIG